MIAAGGVAVGLVAAVALWYATAAPDDVTAHSVDQDSTLAGDDACDEDYVRVHGGYFSNGVYFLPRPGGGFGQYHYTYGGTVGPDRRVTGGTLTAPSADTTVRTNSGKVVQRGGFGTKGGSGGS